VENLRTKLKNSTQAAHTKIESNPVLAKLLSPSIDEKTYRAILLRYFGFFSNIESQLVDSGGDAAIPNLRERFRAPRLRNDLLALGLSEQEINSAPRASEIPRTSTKSEVLGVMYVLEGSTLGGMLIAKHLRSFPFFGETTGSFFLTDPQALSQRWKAFLELLETSSDLDEASAVEAASSTFTLLDRWMEGVDVTAVS
jgi:heme oxygenase (biliverdin-IX-beta and delta-forming)